MSKLTTWQVLRAKFPATEYVLIAEVSDASGFSRSRSMDYMIINLWESRGLAISGIEQKSNRSDWLKELKNPKKQENHFKYCDYFYLLTDKPDVAKLEEIPANWGWYHINDKQILKTMKGAPKLDSIPVPRTLLCAMLRRAAEKTGYVHRDSIQEEIKVAEERARVNLGYEKERKVKEYGELLAAVIKFKEASGIDISDRWNFNAKQTGEAVQVLKNGGIKKYCERLKRLEEDAKHIHESITKSISILSEFQNDIPGV